MGNYLQIIVILLVVGLPALARLWQKLEQKKMERERQAAQERRQVEILRTGRDPEQEARAQAEQQLALAAAQVATQRQAQLAELRRRQQERLRQAAAARQAGSAGAAVAAPTASQTARPQSARPQPTRSQPARATAQRPRSRPKSGTPRVVAPAESPRPFPTEAEPVEGPAHPLGIELGTSISQRSLTGQIAESAPGALNAPVPATPAPLMVPGRGLTPGLILGRPMTGEEWKRAIIMQEILARPLSVRQELGVE